MRHISRHSARITILAASTMLGAALAAARAHAQPIRSRTLIGINTASSGTCTNSVDDWMGSATGTTSCALPGVFGQIQATYNGAPSGSSAHPLAVLGLSGATDSFVSFQGTAGVFDEMTWNWNAGISQVVLYSVLSLDFLPSYPSPNTVVTMGARARLTETPNPPTNNSFTPGGCLTGGTFIDAALYVPGGIGHVDYVDALTCTASNIVGSSGVLSFKYFVDLFISATNTSPGSPMFANAYIDATHTAYIGGVTLLDAAGNDITATAWSSFHSTQGFSYAQGRPNITNTPLLPVEPPPPPTTSPEPATSALVAGGLLSLGAFARRRRASGTA